MRPHAFTSLAALQAGLAELHRQHGGAVYHLLVLHGPNCSPLGCRCHPSFRLEELTTDNYLEGQRAERQWARETLS